MATAGLMWLKVYDPERTPAHWLEIIRPGEYSVFILKAQNRTPTDAQGRPFRAGAASVEIAPGLDEAVRFAERVVAAHPELCCEIYDHEGKVGEPLKTVYEPSVRGRYEGLPHAKRETRIGLALIAAATGFIVYDFLHELVWLWGYIVGVKLLIIGGAYLVRGVAGICEHRYDRQA